MKKAILVGTGALALVLAAGTGGAVASGLIHGSDIANHTITGQNLAGNSVNKGKITAGAVGLSELNKATKNYIDSHAGKNGKNGVNGKDGTQGPAGPAGPNGADGTPGATGPVGPAGANGLAGAVYRVENYKNGGGGDATVACADDETTSQTYTAIAGGVEAGATGSNDFAVTASFPGRMDWDTGLPKANRLDGWIILGNGKYTSTLKVWALCVPTTDIAVQEVTIDN